MFSGIEFTVGNLVVVGVLISVGVVIKTYFNNIILKLDQINTFMIQYKEKFLGSEKDINECFNIAKKNRESIGFLKDKIAKIETLIDKK